MPLLGELTLESTKEVTSKIIRATKPLLCNAEVQEAHTLCFMGIRSRKGFDIVLSDVLADLCGYGRPNARKPGRESSDAVFPCIEAGSWRASTKYDRAQEASLMEVGQAAHRVRALEHRLASSERNARLRRVLPEFEPLLREAEQLAFRIVRLQQRSVEYVDKERDEWLWGRGYMPQPVFVPAVDDCGKLVLRPNPKGILHTTK